MSLSQLKAHILELQSLLQVRDDRIDMLSNVLQDIMDEDAFVDTNDNLQLECWNGSAEPSGSRKVQHESSAADRQVNDTESITSNFLQASTLPSLMERMCQFVDGRRQETTPQPLLRRACIAFLVALERIVPAELLREARQVEPDAFHHQHVRHVRDVDKFASDVVELLAALDSAGFFETSWPEHVAATM